MKRTLYPQGHRTPLNTYGYEIFNKIQLKSVYLTISFFIKNKENEYTFDATFGLRKGLVRFEQRRKARALTHKTDSFGMGQLKLSPVELRSR